jgi:hypothetical protein
MLSDFLTEKTFKEGLKVCAIILLVLFIISGMAVPLQNAEF